MSSKTIGSMRHRVVIETVTRSDDGGGGAGESWSALATLWARIVPLAGTEKVEGQQIAGTITHHIMLRYRNDILPDMRIRYGVRVFHVLAALNVNERGRWTMCLCEERNL